LLDALQYGTLGSTWSRPTFNASITGRALDLERDARPRQFIDATGKRLLWRVTVAREFPEGELFIQQIKSFTLVYAGAADEDTVIGNDNKQ
jgi:hypothetical protein